ncbi:MAG: GGDEF domain-containing protein [Gorillibacterium sp.]|nr:GGDEF domain-containing protein [Gorillibacterium sp.]
MGTTDLTNIRRLDRNILNVYWAIWTFVPFIEMIYILLGRNEGSNSQLFTLSLALLLNIVILFTVEIIFHVWKRSHPYFILGVGILTSFILIRFQAEMSVIYFVFLFPLLLSVFYFRKTYTIVTTVFCLLAVYLLYAFFSDFRGYLQLSSLFSYTIIVIGISVLLILLVDQVKYLMRSLSSALEAKRELMVRNIVMDKMVKTDPLTGLYTHTAFHNYLGELTEQYARMPFHIHLAVIDVDFFKLINDNYGHRVGDMILTDVSGIIRNTIGPDDFAARCGGEEFAILFLEKDMEQVYAVVEIIRARISMLTHPEIPNLKVTVSIGLNEYLPDMDKDEFYKETDDYMYAAKKSGKNRTVRDRIVGSFTEQEKPETETTPLVKK